MELFQMQGPFLVTLEQQVIDGLYLRQYTFSIGTGGNGTGAFPGQNSCVRLCRRKTQDIVFHGGIGVTVEKMEHVGGGDLDDHPFFSAKD